MAAAASAASVAFFMSAIASSAFSICALRSVSETAGAAARASAPAAMPTGSM
jgi:hypothetical protein